MLISTVLSRHCLMIKLSIWDAFSVIHSWHHWSKCHMQHQGIRCTEVGEAEGEDGVEVVEEEKVEEDQRTKCPNLLLTLCRVLNAT